MDPRIIPILPCRDLDDVLGFYQALGFEQTYRQTRPNPYLCLTRSGLDLHFAAVPGLDPENSLSSILVLVEDTGTLYDEFAAGLRAAYGKIPVAGIPRITRPRRKQGTSGGFSLVDPGGNWLRITSAGSGEKDAGGTFERVMLNAARQGDSHGDEVRAIAVLEAGLIRHAEASAVERVPVLVYLAELLIRTGDAERATAVLAEIDGLEVDKAEVAAELAVAAELVAGLRS